MKTIATTPNGGRIVEFTEEEHKAFVMAQNAANGLTIENIWMSGLSPSISSDMSQFFNAMEMFVLAKFKLNDMENYVESLRLALNIKIPVKIQKEK